MDNLTHTLLGVALSRAGLQRITPRATLLLVLASNIPDADMLSLAGGQLSNLENHRGYTHTFLALPILALLCVALTALPRKRRLPILKAWLVAAVGVGGHLLLDWTNSFGVRPWLPFSSRWYYLDLNGLYDGVILIALAMALVWPWFLTLIENEIGIGKRRTGQGSAITVLLLLLLFEGGRWMLHQRALAILNSKTYDGEIPIHAAALPEPGNPFHWTGIVETGSAYRLVPTSVFDLGDLADARIFFKPPRDAIYRTVSMTEPFRYMQYFSRFPAWRIEPFGLPSGLGKKVQLTDLRFGVPGSGHFEATALLDGTGRLLESRFSFVPQP